MEIFMLNYVLTGEAVDQETIIRQRSWYEDEVKKMGIEFSKTQLKWNIKNNGNFSFKLEFIN